MVAAAVVVAAAAVVAAAVEVDVEVEEKDDNKGDEEKGVAAAAAATTAAAAAAAVAATGATGAAAGAAGVAGALPDKVLDKAESEEDLEQQLAPPAGQTGSYAHPSTLSMYLERRPWTSCPRRSTLPSLPHHSVKRPIDEPAMISEPLSAMAQETIFGNSG